MATAAERLAEVQMAISRIAATGQSYRTADGREWTGANLATLMQLERILQSQVNSGNDGLAINHIEI